MNDRKTIDLDSAEESVSIPQPPAPPPSKRRCRTVINGQRCIRAVKAKGFCAAHWRECCDQQEMALRTDLDIPVREPFQYEGDEAMLAQIYGRNR